MSKKIFRKISALLLVSVMLFAAGCANTTTAPEKAKETAKYPEKDMNFVVWSSAGSSLDVFMRQLAQPLSKDLGKNIAVENKTGGSGAVAMSYVDSLPADGYNILSTTGLSLIHISEPTRLGMNSYAVFCLKKKKRGRGQEDRTGRRTHSPQRARRPAAEN